MENKNIKYIITINRQPVSRHTGPEFSYQGLMNMLSETPKMVTDGIPPCFDDIFVQTDIGTWHMANHVPIVRGANIKLTTFIDAPLSRVICNKEMGVRHHCGNPETPCAWKLANGECRDVFMRKIGAILYPALYGKMKENTK